MRSLRLMGQEVVDAIRETAKELELPGPFEVDPATGKPFGPYGEVQQAETVGEDANAGYS